MPWPLIQRNARGLRLPPSVAEALANPTTSPRWLIAIGVFQATPPRSPISISLPCSQRTLWMALNRPTAWSQMPEMPTTWPKSLSAVAAVTVSSVPGSGRSCRICGSSPGPQTTARN